LNAFDMLRTELVHGWLLEPDAEEYDIIGSKTYNQLVNMVIEGNDAATTLQNADSAKSNTSVDHDTLSVKATQGMIVKDFLDRSGHQLTQYGLDVLHEQLQDGKLVVFFRNNHFNTLTKHKGLLYLLVTDFGYANVSTVVWEKLDVIDGDTEYVNAQFSTSPASSNVNDVTTSSSNDPQSQADYQLALQLSKEQAPLLPTPGRTPQAAPYDADLEAAQRASVEEYNRLNPDNPVPIERSPPWPSNSRADISTSFVEQMALFTERMRQAGTSLQDVAASASNILQPARFTSTTTASGHMPTPNTPVQPCTPPPLHQQLPEAAVMGIPVGAMSPQEAEDMKLAMQLQREDENGHAHPSRHLESDQILAQQLSQHGGAEYVSHRGLSPGSRPTITTMRDRAADSKKENCVIH
jgi:MINDY deubiquitinase